MASATDASINSSALDSGSSTLADWVSSMVPMEDPTPAPLNCSGLEMYSNGLEMYSNGSNSSMCRIHEPTVEVEINANLMYTVLIIFYLMVFIVGITGNSLVIYVVLRYSKMQTVTNMYILNLALADELFLIVIPFLIATIIIKQWMFGSIMCKVYMTNTSITQFTSSILLTVMSADRYIAVCHPITSPRYRTPIISKVVCLTAWTASALMMLPIFMYADVQPAMQNPNCNILWPDVHTSGQVAFTLYGFFLGFALPVAFISIFYTLVVKKLKTVGLRKKSKEKRKSHRKVTKLVLTVVTVYVACWLPYWVGQLTLIFTQSNQSHDGSVVMIFLAASILTYSNSAINPILYAFLSENFKKSFIKACICAGGKEVNAQLHLENSVFPRKTRPGSEKTRTKEQESDDDGNDPEQSTAITMTSRSNNLAPNGGGERDPMLNNCRNGYHKSGAVESPNVGHKPTQV